MYYILTLIRSKTALIFIITVLAVIFLEYYLLHGSLTLGFKPDDWILYFSYKLLGSEPLSKILSVWAQRGVYTTYQVYYMGLLDSLFGLNYYLFHWFNLILKIIATLSLYPLVVILFKNKLLAILTVILFSISHASVGSLEFVVKGSDYLAIVWMNLFLIVYYLIVKNRVEGIKYYFFLFLLFILSLSLSPIRIFPLIVIPPLVEIFLTLKYLDWAVIKKSLTRLAILYWPFILLILYSPVSVLGDAKGPIAILEQVSKGNWFYLLAPFSGMGYLFITNDFWWKIFSLIITDNFNDYLLFLAGGPTVICGALTLLITLSRILKRKFLFFILTMLLNFIFQAIIFFVALKMQHDQINLYSVIFGGYISVVGFMVFLNWLKWGSNDRVLASFWIGSAFLFVFTFLTWLFAPLGTGFTGTSYYLVVASIGSSLMVSAFLVSIYYKLKFSRVKLLAFLPFFIIIPVFGMSSREIRQVFSDLNKDGRGAEGQIIMQEEAKRVLKDYKAGDFILVYFDTSDISGNEQFYSEGFLISFPFFTHFRDNKIADGCIGVVHEDSQMVKLRESVQAKDGRKGFNYQGLCVIEGKSALQTLFFPSDNFYAFKIKDRKLIDIKGSVLDQLSFKENE